LILDGLKKRLRQEQQKGRQVDQWDLISNLGASRLWVRSYIIVWCHVAISSTENV
jgi:hypothetical protein